MFEKFDKRAREVVTVAGNIAARRERAKTGEAFPRRVRVQVSDMREALELLAPKDGWAGGFNGPLSRRFEKLRTETTGSQEPITLDKLREIVK